MDRSARSKFPSIKLDQLVYIELDASNGGMMLTVSEEGFSFRAVSSRAHYEPHTFFFRHQRRGKLEGFGKIEWTKDDGKVAGLLFTDVTSEFLDALRVWLGQLCVPAAPPAPTHRQPDSRAAVLRKFRTGQIIRHLPRRTRETAGNGQHFSASVEPPALPQQGFERPVAEQPVYEHAHTREPWLRR